MTSLLAQLSHLWNHSKVTQAQDAQTVQVPPSKALLANTHRAQHVGSLLRPANLYEQRQLFLAHKCFPDVLQAAEDDAIKHVIKLQKDCGMYVITDGELRRSVFKLLSLTLSGC